VAGERVPMSYERGMGVHAITRHPGLWGFGLWAVGHLMANGDAATVILCSGIAVLAFGGMLALDARKTAAFPETYGAFAATPRSSPSSPWRRAARGSTGGASGWPAFAATIVVYVGLLFAHGLVIGLSALPV
jgi:uncharacterized membrane protein